LLLWSMLPVIRFAGANSMQTAEIEFMHEPARPTPAAYLSAVPIQIAARDHRGLQS
jgi:hypothetical protein